MTQDRVTQDHGAIDDPELIERLRDEGMHEAADKIEELQARCRNLANHRIAAEQASQPTSNALRKAVIEECAAIAEQYQHAWGEGNNPICGLVAADIRALARGKPDAV